MTHRGPFQPLLFCDSVICHTVPGEKTKVWVACCKETFKVRS